MEKIFKLKWVGCPEPTFFSKKMLINITANDYKSNP